MALELLSTYTATALLAIISLSIFARRRLRTSPLETLQAAKKSQHGLLDPVSSSLGPSLLSKSLAAALPDSVIFPQDAPAFKQSMNAHWAQQESEVIPACIVRPRDVQQLCTTVTILKREFDEREKKAGEGQPKGLFAVRGGGHSPVPGAASIKGGVVIDLSLFCEVAPSEDGSSVVIGAGARWGDVSKILDVKGLAVVGGRNSAVGVGGLTLGGGLSFFSPRFGMVCSNILSYEIVLASGSITTASESTNRDLWRALKGGSNNFGIVTRFTVRSFPCSKIWSGFLYVPAFQASQVLAAFHKSVEDAGSGGSSNTYNHHVAGPIACFTYIQQLRMQVISVNLVHTEPLENEKQWPVYWKTSPFKSLWRFWSTFQVRTLTSGYDEMNALNPPGRRQVFATTTIKNDPATLTATHAAYDDAIASLRRVGVEGLVWTLVLQPLPAARVRQGEVNPLGLHDGADEPLVIVSFTVNWDRDRDDKFVQMTTRGAIERMDDFAAAHDTGHRYRYLNYCAAWQKPFASYGEENWRFLRGVSKKYDPEGLFQRGCAGGFKLDDVVESEA